MENLNPEILFPPSKEKIETRNKNINNSILSLGIESGNKVVHFGCGSRNKSFINDIKDIGIIYNGIDVNRDIIDECISLFKSSTMIFNQSSIQSFIDDNENTDSNYDWTIIDGLFDKNIYDDYQYEFVDTVIRKLLTISNIGMVIIMDGRQTIDDDTYNTDFMTAFIGSMYNRYNIIRLNENQFIFCVYKYYV